MALKKVNATQVAPVAARQGVVYSTNPSLAVDQDGHEYFIKGPDVEVVFAEVAGTLLARAVGLLVPDIVICLVGGQEYAGSVMNPVRELDAWLRRPRELVSNHEILYSCIVVDAWLANTDRNFGNFVGEPAGKNKVTLKAIDFEKSVALRPNPIICSNMVRPGQIWPTGDLGKIVSANKPLHPPQGQIAAILNLGRDRCVCAATEAADGLSTKVHWLQNSIQALEHRAQAIQGIMEAVW